MIRLYLARKKRCMEVFKFYFYRQFRDYKFDLQQSNRVQVKKLLETLDKFNWKMANDFAYRYMRHVFRRHSLLVIKYRT